MSLVVAVHRSPVHGFSKDPVDAVTLVTGHGVEGDAHAGATVQHRSRVHDPVPNLRQVHLLHVELLRELDVPPGALGENLTTEGLDLLSLSAGTLLRVGPSAVLSVTGLRNPCVQIERYRSGLLDRVRLRRPDGTLGRLTGVMSVVLADGVVRPGDAVVVSPPAVHVPLAVV